MPQSVFLFHQELGGCVFVLPGTACCIAVSNTFFFPSENLKFLLEITATKRLGTQNERQCKTALVNVDFLELVAGQSPTHGRP